ncbi:MAG: squalene--hopene cyclase [Pirellulales bacterium]
MSYSVCPAVPPEMVLLPAWFPLNLSKVSAWSRTMIVPLSLMWSFKPVRTIPASAGVRELFDSQESNNSPSVGGGGFWGHFFRGVDKVIKFCDSIGLQPLRSRAVQACRRWMLERFDGSDGLGAIFPPIIWSIVALRAMGCEETSPEVQESWRQLHGLIETEEDGSRRVEPCRSPVWDTAIALRSLSDAAAAGICGGGAFWRKLNTSVDWLLDRELCGVGDWQEGLSSCLRPQEASGWCFQYANRFYPDVDDTAMVLIAFAEWRRSWIGRADQSPEDPSACDRLRRVDVAVKRAFDWLCAMQNSDGGWAAFDRNNNLELLCRVPFADHNAMIDPSTPDITGRVLEAMGRLGYQRDHRVVASGIEYLRGCQEQNGAWFGRWGVNYIYGTWQVLEGLRAVGVSGEDPLVQRALSWLVSRQHSEGSWGESPESYADPSLAGIGSATPSQTAWAIAGLVSAQEVEGAAARGVRWLVDQQSSDGDWEELDFTGTGFPKVFYLRYHFYRVYFPLMAMARWCRAKQDVFQCGSLTRGMVA